MNADYLRSCVDYDQETGAFKFRSRPVEHFKTLRIANMWNTRFAGKATGRLTNDGYVRIVIDRKMYPGHRVAWLYMTDEWPEHDIDHINRIRSDNRFANLRQATRSQNLVNSAPRNRCGFKGVRRQSRGSWRADIGLGNGSILYLGSFPTPEQASEAFQQKAHELWGEFAQ